MIQRQLVFKTGILFCLWYTCTETCYRCCYNILLIKTVHLVCVIKDALFSKMFASLYHNTRCSAPHHHNVDTHC